MENRIGDPAEFVDSSHALVTDIDNQLHLVDLRKMAIADEATFCRGPNAESFRHGGQNGMKERHTGKASAKGGTTDWKRLDSLSDKEIGSAIEADPEARPTDANFWKKAKVTLPRPKQTVTIRLDADLLGWLRRQKGYQTRINAVLRTYMEAHKS